MATFTQGNLSIDVTGHTSSGQHIDGSHWVAGSSLSISNPVPAPTGTGQAARHGAMWDPVGSPSGFGQPRDGTWVTAYQGYDGRIKVVGSVTYTDYDETKNVWGANGGNLPVTVNLAPGDVKSLVFAKSRNLARTELVTDSAWGSNPVAIEEMIVITFYGTAPGANAFRPNYSGTTKYLFSRSDYNAALLPNLNPSFGNPKGTTSSDFHLDIGSNYSAHNVNNQTEYYQTNGERMQYSVMASEAISQTALAPWANQPYFPYSMGHIYGQLGLYAMCNFGTTGAGADATENKASSVWAHETLLQIGIDYLPIGLAKGPAGGAGYAFRGLLFPILYAGIFFNNSTMKTIASRSSGTTDNQGYPLSPFSEVHRCKSSTNADAQYRYPRPRADYPNGPPLWGDAPDVQQTTAARPYFHNYQTNHNIRDPDLRFTAHANSRDVNTTFKALYPVGTYVRTDPDNPNVNLRNQVMENAGTYDELAYTLVPQMLVMHILGQCALWNNDALVDYIDWLTEDKRLSGYYDQPINARNGYFSDFVEQTYYEDVYRFGGRGNGWCTKMWRTYRRNSTYRGKVRRRFGLKNTTVNIPVNYEAPEINTVYGTSNGDGLSASKGKWRDNPTSWSYQWQRDGVDIVGATNLTYTISTAAGDTAGKVIRVGTKATNSAGTAAAFVYSAGVTVT